MNRKNYANAILILHKYWIWSTVMQSNFYKLLPKLQNQENYADFHISEVGIFMMYWYSSLYVVVEEYQNLKIKNSVIDSLCSDSDKVKLLRLFRNAAFHVQKDYFSEKYTDFIATENAAK